MSYDQFYQEWDGRRVDYDNVYAYQCVDLILQYLKECYGINSGVWGNAIDYWTKPTPVLLSRFTKVNSSDAKKGDIVVLYGHAGNPYGHIGICDHADADNVWLLEQNAMGDGTGTGKSAIGVWRSIPKSRIAGLLRPSTAPVPPPAPVARQFVTLPSWVVSWRVYRIGSGLRPNTSDQVGVLSPAYYGGLTYRVESWVGDYAVVIQTQYYGRVIIWVKGTDAEFKYA